MKSHTIRYNPEAIGDLMASFEWGVKVWGSEAATKWYNEIEAFIARRLSSMPEGCSVAPEDTGLDIEIRQLIFGRYRILFSIHHDRVLVLHIRGPFVAGESDNLN